MEADMHNRRGEERCNNCEKIAKIKAENRRLRKEQEILFLLLDLGMIAVEIWGEKNGLLGSEENLDKDLADGDNQISMLLQQIGKSGKNSRMDRFVAFLNLLQGAE